MCVNPYSVICGDRREHGEMQLSELIPWRKKLLLNTVEALYALWMYELNETIYLPSISSLIGRSLVHGNNTLQLRIYNSTDRKANSSFDK
ncbi:unnamed protein product [Calicophoron daubneyi]|uniref:Uncharacterized protein n=1 Tax=Calicophoron daubneyi TaxID=300641 RepID=A0AAV2T8X2_CALDB